MKKWLAFTLFSFSALLMSCTSVGVDKYAGTTPEFDLFDYFSGELVAHGQFQSFSGQVRRRFVVDINGEVEGDTLTLTEDFVYDDGEEQTRVWTIKKQGDKFVGTASDVIGEAVGESSGYTFHWEYDIDLPYKDGTIKVHFDDWMYQQNSRYLLNRARVTKFGVQVGEVTIFFDKTPS
jgi:hypothetical protein